ncbi:DUF1642 domain-containing protein [Listeria sp. SHR_NRA_18]|uniref:DUF1642 domain-containing protein n=1 Tax=Listeria TaxID=1637 RepID=UPI000F5F664A|nr:MULTISPECIES: DUF1642 domain-containing protein [Listeria]RQW65825.1 DUF1642 domain-containing protein [Listeria sp. SHR_NRA_18]WAO22066.1 DUF1642 domain-containing protein [Listeria newyorkensis]
MTQQFRTGDTVQFTGEIRGFDVDERTLEVSMNGLNRVIRMDSVVPAPALVVVPQWFDTIYRDTKRVYLEGKYDACNVDMIRMICAAEFGSSHNQLIAFTDKLSTAATEYVIKHKLDLIRAVLDGYTVEKEPLYYVKVVDDKCGYLNYEVSSGIYDLADKGNDDDVKTQYTELEIKEINEKLWAVAVPVKDDEA